MPGLVVKPITSEHTRKSNYQDCRRHDAVSSCVWRGDTASDCTDSRLNIYKTIPFAQPRTSSVKHEHEQFGFPRIRLVPVHLSRTAFKNIGLNSASGYDLAKKHEKISIARSSALARHGTSSSWSAISGITTTPTR